MSNLLAPGVLDQIVLALHAHQEHVVARVAACAHPRGVRVHALVRLRVRVRVRFRMS